jgi:hypothetical protein
MANDDEVGRAAIAQTMSKLTADVYPSCTQEEAE